MREAGAGREEPPFDALAADLGALFSRGIDAPLDDTAFDHWARRVFRWQFHHNPTYRGYCVGRGATPDSIGSWEEIPPVPTAAFKRLRLFSVEESKQPEAIFETSGTTLTEKKGEHWVASLALYRSALLPPFRAHLLPDGARFPVVALLPPPDQAPRSSLSRMIAAVHDTLGAEGGGFFGAPDGSIRDEALLGALLATVEAKQPVLVATTAFGLVHWLDTLMRGSVRLVLPEGSRMMETGGFKGRARAVSRAELYDGVHDALGLPADRIVNEYGMTEMLSQFYEPTLSEPLGPDLSERFHVAPPWVRTRVLDPVTLDPVADDQPGLLCHHDLANAGSVAAVLTEDMGVQLERGFRLLGRAPGAEPRGCSLATEELLESATMMRAARK